MGTLAPTRGAGCREHVQSARARKPPEAAEAPGGRRRSAAPTRPGRPPPALVRPQRPPHAPRGPPVGGDAGHGGAPRRPRAGAPPAPPQRRPWQPSGVVRGRAPELRDAPSGFGRPGEAPRRDPAGGATRAAPAKHEQGAGRAAGHCVPGNSRPGAPPRTAASLRGRVREVPRPVLPAPAPKPAAKSRGQNPRGTQPPPPQVSQRTATTVPGRGGAHARAAPPVVSSSAALQRGRARQQQARAGPVAPKERALPHDRTLAAKRAPAAGSASSTRPLQPRPERHRAAARGGALDRHGGTRPDTKREQLPRAPPPQSKCTGPGSCCAPKAAAGASRCAGGAPASRQPAVGTGREARTPAPTGDRRQLLQHWVISRGRSYKRPPMSVPAKMPRKKAQETPERPSRGGLAEKDSEEEEEKREQLHLADQIGTVLAECQQLAEKGFPPEELLAMLSRIPEAERFAQFWICKARLLARQSTCDVAKLYEAAVCAGAAPIQELRDVVVDILKQAQAPPANSCLFPEEGRSKLRSAQGALQPPTHKPISAVKLQVLPLLRAKEPGLAQGMKILTPVRRSLRIEHALARYPLMLQDHDPVVSSLAELMATEKEGQFVFRPNDALPEEGPEALLGL